MSTLIDQICREFGVSTITDPAGTVAPKPKRQRRPSLAEISKYNLEMRCAPDGSFVIARGKTDSARAESILTPEDELERWRKKKYAG
jgi:hypothetical protein